MNAEKLRFVGTVLGASLLKRRSRLLLVVAALTLVSTLSVALTSVSQGIEARLGEGLKLFGANLVVGIPDRVTGAAGIETGEITQFIDPAEVEPVLAATPGVESFQARVNVPLTLAGFETRLQGIPAAEIEAAQWRFEGRAPGVGEVALGRDLATRLGVEAGGQVELFSTPRTVSGVVETGGAEDDQAIITLDDARALTGGGVSEYLVRATPNDVELVGEGLRIAFPAADVRTLRQVAEAEGRLLDRVRILLITVTIGVALSAAIAVGTTLNLVVLERAEEIGLLKALGGTSGLVVGYFLLEQSASALTAGVAGFFLGTAVAQLVSVSVFGSPLAVSGAAALAGVGIALAIVLVAGAVPAARASRVEAAEALRGL